MSSLAAAKSAAKNAMTSRAPLSIRRISNSTIRCMGTRPRRILNTEPIPPGHTIESVAPPEGFTLKPQKDDDIDPMAYIRNPVSSAIAVDASKSCLSAVDKVSIVGSGEKNVHHESYGEIEPCGIPLEYLALLRPASRGVAAARSILSSSSSPSSTVLIYGASRPVGLSSVQVLSSLGHCVIGVMDGEHGGNDDMCDIVKGMASEPGLMVPEEYALVKKNFFDLVNDASSSDNDSTTVAPTSSEVQSRVVSSFAQNLLEYASFYPDSALPAAVSPSHMVFRSGKEKDRKYFKENMSSYLAQYPKAAPSMDGVDVDDKLNPKLYQDFRALFHKQTTAVITGDEPKDFEPATVIRHMVDAGRSPSPKDRPDLTKEETEAHGFDYVPYHFSIFQEMNKKEGAATQRPIAGAIVVLTPNLKIAFDTVHQASSSLRDKCEALQFLTEAQRNAYAAASSVVRMAKENGGKVLVVGMEDDADVHLPDGFETVEATEEDVRQALDAMKVGDDGTSRLNYFVQVYRAGDFPIYEDYAIHRATEELAGPRQIVVTK